MGRDHLPAAGCQAQGRLRSSSPWCDTSRQQEHGAWDGGAERSSTPHLYGKPPNASRQSKQLLAWLHCPKSLAQSWPGREGCKEGRLKGKPLQLGGGTGSTKGCPGNPDPGAPGRAANLPLQKQLPMCWRLLGSCKPVVKTQSLRLFTPTQHIFPLQKPQSSSPGLIPQPGST